MLVSAQTVADRPELESALAREMRRLIAVDGRSIDAVGLAAGFSSGYLSQILRGKQDLKIRHLARVLEVLEVPAWKFFEDLAQALWKVERGTAGEIAEARRPYAGRADLDYIERRAREEGERDRRELEALVRRIVRLEVGGGGDDEG